MNISQLFIIIGQDSSRYYENILIREVFTEAWIYTIPDRSDEVDLEKLTKVKKTSIVQFLPYFLILLTQ